VTTQLVFPYRGVYVRHVGQDQAVAEANQVLFFNATESYRISHPVEGGDACLTLVISEPLLQELAPRAFLRDSATLAFQQQRRRIDARAQVLVALIGHSLRHNITEPLEAESLALALVQRALGPRTTHAAGASVGTPAARGSGKARADKQSGAALDVGRDRRGSALLSGLSHAGFPTSRRLAFVSLPVAATIGAGAGFSRALRRPDYSEPRPRILKS